MIDRDKLNAAVEKALEIFVSLMPTMISSLRVKQHATGLEFTVGNPQLSERPISIFTEGGEIIVCFAGSDYHIADYDDRRTEAELVEDMILGVAGIVGGHLEAYEWLNGDVTIARGLMPAGSHRGEQWLDGADQFKVFTWETCGDYTLSKPITD
jgi:hypothetical protein